MKRLLEMGIKHYTIPDIEKKNAMAVTRTVKTLKTIMVNENITVIHTHHRMAAFYVRLLRLDKKCYFINTSHNTFFNKKIFTQFSYKNCNLVSCGEIVKENLVNTFGLTDVVVIHNAVKPFDGNIKTDELLESLRDSGYSLIGNIGRLSKQKGLEYFIGAIPAVLEECPYAKFLIVGSGEEEDKLRKLIKEKGLLDAAYLMGYRNDIQNLMAQMDLVVLSSLWEGLPLTPIEAFSVGRAVIATDVDGTVEIVENEKNGFLVEPKNIEQLAEKIIFLVKNVEKRKEMERAAEKRYLEFSFEMFTERYIGFYKQI